MGCLTLTSRSLSAERTGRNTALPYVILIQGSYALGYLRDGFLDSVLAIGLARNGMRMENPFVLDSLVKEAEPIRYRFEFR